MEEGNIYKICLDENLLDEVGKKVLAEFMQGCNIEWRNGKLYIDGIKSYNHHFYCLNSYSGIMLTHSDRFENNFPLEERFIQEGHEFIFENSKYFARILIKQIPDELLKQTGRFTPCGISYMKSIEKSLPVSTWKKYLEDRGRMSCRNY